MKRLAVWLSVLVSLASPLAAEGSDEQVTTFSLDNGLDVVVIEDHRAPVVVHMVWYKSGAADETRGVSGVAHFLEHLLFKGTDTLASGEFSAKVAENGGNDNAFTSYDYTAFFQRVAADRLPLMMDMESDRMVNLRLDEDDILTERKVIIEERNQRIENDPGSLFREQRMASLYLNSPYGTPIIGWRHEMENLGLEDALAYYKEYYAPNNAILVVAGDTDPGTVRALAEQTFGKLPANPDLPVRARPQEPPQTAERRLTYRDPRVAQPYIVRTYLAPERDSGAQEKAAALVCLAEILGGGQTAVLNRALQFDSQTAIYTSAFYSPTSLDDTSFGLVVVPAEGVSMQQAEDALDRTLAQFMAGAIDPAQLDRIKFQMRAQDVYARDDVQSLAQRYGRSLTAGLTVADIKAWPDVLQAVTPEDIKAAAREVFDRKQSVTGWLMKDEEMTQ